MKRSIFSAIIIMTFSIAATVHAEDKATSANKVVTCKSGKAVRTLTTSTPAGGGCMTMYNKGDSESKVAEAKNDISYCEKIVERIKGKLEGSGFTCQ